MSGTWDGLLRRLRELDYRAAIVGSDGSGKTTLLEDLAPRLADLDFTVKRLFLNDQGVLRSRTEAATRASRDPSLTLRMTGSGVNALHCHSERNEESLGRALAASPTRFTSELGGDDIVLFDGADLMSRLAWARFKRRTRRAAGLIVTSHRPGVLPTLIECRTTPELLDDIVVQILGDGAGLGELPHRLFEKHQGNLRDALRELYDMYSASASPKTEILRCAQDDRNTERETQLSF